MVGPMVVEATQMQRHSGMLSLGFLPAPPSEFANDPLAVRQAVYDQHAWAAIIINPNATAILQEAVTSGNTSYDPLGAAQIVYVEARDDTTHYNYVLPLLNSLQTQITSMFGEQWVGMLLKNASTDPTLLSNLQKVPQAVNPAIGFSIFSLRPFYPPTATPAVSIGLICESRQSRSTPKLTIQPRLDHFVLFLLFVLPSDPYEIHSAKRAPATTLLPTDHLAMDGHNAGLLLHLALLLVDITGIPDSFLESSCSWDCCGHQPKCISSRHFCGLLDDQLCWHDRTWNCL
jgi:hypothetical protein